MHVLSNYKIFLWMSYITLFSRIPQMNKFVKIKPNEAINTKLLDWILGSISKRVDWFLYASSLIRLESHQKSRYVSRHQPLTLSFHPRNLISKFNLLCGLFFPPLNSYSPENWKLISYFEFICRVHPRSNYTVFKKIPKLMNVVTLINAYGMKVMKSFPLTLI